MTDRLRRLSQLIEDRVGVLRLLVAATVIFIVGVAGVYTKDSNGPVVGPSSSTSSTAGTAPSTTATGERRGPGIPGFSTVSFTIGGPGRAPSTHCGLLADTADQLSKGMMGQKDLGGYDAMIFHFATDSTAAFYTANVPMALSIAWFDSSGNFVSSADMPVCAEAEAKNCPRYFANGPFRDALEVPGGGLGALGAEAGSSFALGGPCV